MESITLTLSSNSSILTAYYNPPIELLPNKNYTLGLVTLLTSNSIPNINVGQNRFYIGDQVIEIPTGSYEISEIESYLQETIKQRKSNTTISLKPNNNTLRSEINASEDIDFRPSDTIANLLGFDRRVLKANFHHTSNYPVNILKANSLRVECSITSGAYINNQRVHTIHEFFPTDPPGFKIIEVPKQIIYLPVSVKTIDNLQLRIVDQDGDLVDFRGEVITIRLHIKSS